MSGEIVRVDALRSLGFASISGTYAAVGTAFGHPMNIVKFINNTNADLTISFDGSTNNDFVPAGGFSLYDLTTNRTATNATFVFQLGTQVYVKGSPTSGSFYVVAIYTSGT